MRKDRNNNESGIPEELNELSSREEALRFRRKKKKGGFLKYIILIILLLVLVYGAIKLLGSADVNSEGYAAVSAQIELESSTQYDFVAVDRYVVSCNANGVVAYDKAGKEKWRIDKFFSDPSVYFYEDNILVTDTAQNTAAVIGKNGKIKNEIVFPSKPVAASVNKNGWVSAILSVKGYKAQVAVYDENGQMKYTWNSANNDVISAELSPDNRTLAVAQLDSTSSVEANGVISLFDITTEGKPYSGKNTEANIVTYIRWSGDKLICLGNKAVLKMDSLGKELWKYEFPGEVLAFNADSDAVFAFAVSPNNTSSAKSAIVYTLNDDGKQLGNVEIVGEIKNIEINSSNIAAVTSDKIVTIKKNGIVKKEYTLSRDVSKGIGFDGNRNFFVVSGNSAEVLTLN